MSKNKCQKCPLRIGFEVSQLTSEEATQIKHIINMLIKRIGENKCSTKQSTQVTLGLPKTIS